MGHNIVVSGHLKSIGILRVDWLSMGPWGFGASQTTSVSLPSKTDYCMSVGINMEHHVAQTYTQNG